MTNVRKRSANYFTDSEESDFDFTESDDTDSDDDSELLLESEEESVPDQRRRTSVRSIPNTAVIPKRQMNVQPVQPNSRLPRKPFRAVGQQKRAVGKNENRNNNRSRNTVCSVKEKKEFTSS